jgi:hypothetical protein
MEGAPDAGLDWFFTAKGEQLGPVAWEELVELAKLGGLHPRTDMVWKAGMADWVPAGEVDGLFERRRQDEPAAAGMAATATSAGDGVWDNELDDPHLRSLAEPSPGVGRAGYFLCTVIVPVAGQFGLLLLTPFAVRMFGAEMAQYLPFGAFGFGLIALYATVMRFPNLGMSKWWTLGLLVPILGLWVGYRCFACPPGYASNKKLDGIGWVLAIVYWLAVVTMVVGIVLAAITFGAALADPETLQRLIEQTKAQGR